MYLWGSLKQVLCPDKQVLTGTVPAIPYGDYDFYRNLLYTLVYY